MRSKMNMFRFTRSFVLAGVILLNTGWMTHAAGLPPQRSAGSHTDGTTHQEPLPLLSRSDLLIDVGHGGVDGGTSFGPLLEKQLNLAVALKLHGYLRQKHYSVAVNRISDYALSEDNSWLHSTRHRRDLTQRIEIANKLNPRYMISLHVNWSSDRRKRGALVIYQKKNESSKLLADRIQSALNRVYSTETKAEPGRKYFILRRSNVPAVIVEMGYLSYAGDRLLLINPSHQQKLAKAIGDAVIQAIRADKHSAPSNE